MATVADAGTCEPAASGNAASVRDKSLVTFLYLPFCLLGLLPFLLVEHPPITDYANHVARLWVACNLADPAVGAMYQYRLGIVPNLAVDLVNAPLCGVVSPAAVVKGATAGALCLIYLSGWLIQRRLLGQPNVFLLALPAISLNLVTTMGYVNYLAGAAVACLLVALIAGRNRRFGELLLIGNLGGLVLFFCHIFALAFAGLFMFGMFVARAKRNVRGIVEAGLRTGAMFALPLLLVPFVAQGSGGFEINYENKPRLLFALFMSHHGSLGVNGLLLLFPLFWAMSKGRLRLHPALRWPLAVIGVFVLLAPSAIQEAVDVDSRTLIPLACLFFAGLQPIAAKRIIERCTAVVTLALIAWNLWSAGTTWVRFDQQVAELRSAMQVLPRQTLLLAVDDEAAVRRAAAPLAYGHLASYATIDRQVFNPLEFTGVGMQPMRTQPAFAAVDTPALLPFSIEIAAKLKNPDADLSRRADEADAGFAVRWPERFDHVLFFHFERNSNFDPQFLTPVHRGSFFSILKINRPQSHAKGRPAPAS